MAAAHKKSGKFTEIERKFDVDEAAVTPSFDGLTSVAQVDALPVQTLDAVYYDTAGHDLARHRITLRRRTGGLTPAGISNCPPEMAPRRPNGDPAAAGWGRRAVRGAADLRDIVLAVVRDRPLNPVARIATTRHVRMLYAADGSALAEFCDDEVTAAPSPTAAPRPRWAAGGSGSSNWPRAAVTSRCWTGWASACTTPAPPRRSRVEAGPGARRGDGPEPPTLPLRRPPTPSTGPSPSRWPS
jgi:hypothetical protein